MSFPLHNYLMLRVSWASSFDRLHMTVALLLFSSSRILNQLWGASFIRDTTLIKRIQILLLILSELVNLLKSLENQPSAVWILVNKYEEKGYFFILFISVLLALGLLKPIILLYKNPVKCGFFFSLFPLHLQEKLDFGVTHL